MASYCFVVFVKGTTMKGMAFSIRRTLAILMLAFTIMFAALISSDIAYAESGNSYQTAQNVEFGRKYTEQASAPLSSFWYRIELPSSGHLSYVGSVDQGAYPNPVNMTLYQKDKSGELETLKNSYLHDNKGDGPNLDTTELELLAGEYYLKVYDDVRITADVQWSYSIEFSFTSAEESFDESVDNTYNTILNAPHISLNSTYNGHIAENDKVDWYRFVMPTSGEITLKLEAQMKSGFYSIQKYSEVSGDTETVTEDYAHISSSGVNRLNKTIKLDKGTYYFSFSKGLPLMESVVGAYTFRIERNASFADVSRADYYYDAVNWAFSSGITTGTTANKFSPSDTCSRAQVVTFLWRSEGCPEPSAFTSNPFKDLKSNDYYYKAVLWAVEKGITTGTSNSTFSPNATVTRGQAVTFIYRYKNGSASVTNRFVDVSPSDYYASPVAWAADNGITTGTSSTTFSPNVSCTRGQIVTFLYRANS